MAGSNAGNLMVEGHGRAKMLSSWVWAAEQGTASEMNG